MTGQSETPSPRPDSASAAVPGSFTEFVWEVLLDKRSQDLVWLDVREVTDLADDFIIATFTNPNQGTAIVDACEKERKARELTRLGIEGVSGGVSSWIVLDYGDLVIHLLMPEQRAFYALENLWADARTVREEKASANPDAVE